MKMAFIVAPPPAALRPTAVRCGFRFPLTPPLSPSARCAPRDRTGLTHTAPPALCPSNPKAELQGAPALGSSRGRTLVAPAVAFSREDTKEHKGRRTAGQCSR